MPNSVDTRVVEMQFDNARFEKNINQSIKSLEKLDSSLQFKDADKGFRKIEQAANDVDFSKMEKSLSFIEYRLTALGMTSAKIINSVTNKIGGLFTTLERNTIGQIKSGGLTRALNIEQARFQLEGLGLDVEEITKNAMAAVKGTAYGFDEAAKVASSFGASGIKAGEQMEKALTGVSGVAAMTGRSYADIGHIFTTISSNGKLMTEQLRQFAASGLNVSAALAKEFKKSEAEINDMVQKGKISFQEFSDAMYNAFGEHAKDANKTFNGALSNMKAALSRLGATVATPYIENMREVFIALTDTIDDVHNSLKPLLKIMGQVITDFKNFVVNFTGSSKFINFYQNGIKKLTDLVLRLYDTLSKLKINSAALSDIHDIIAGIGAAVQIVIKVLGQVFNAASPVFQIINVILGVILKLLAALGRLLVDLNKTNTATGKISKVLSTLKTVLLTIIGLIVVLVKGIVSAIQEFTRLPLVQEIFNDIATAAKNLANAALPLLQGAIGGLYLVFDKLITSIRSGNIHDLLSLATEKLTDFYHAAKDGVKAVGAFFGIFDNGIWKLPGSIKAFAKTVDTVDGSIAKLSGVEKRLSGIQKINDSFNEIGEAISSLSGTILNNIKSFGMGRTLITGLTTSLIVLMVNSSKMVKAITSVAGAIPGFMKSLSSALNAPMFDAKAKAIIAGIAVTILSLAAALWVLTKTDTDKLQAVTLCMAELMTLLMLCTVAISKFGGGINGAASMALSLIGFASSITILVAGLKILESINLDFKGMIDRFVLIGLLMAAMVVAMRFLQANTSLFGAGFMLAFAFSISKLIESLAVLADMPLDKIAGVMPILLKLMGGLALVGAACSLLSPLAGIGFAGIIGGLILLIWGLNELAKHLDADPEAFTRMTAILETIYNAIKKWLFYLSIIAGMVALKNLISAISDAVNVVGNTVSALVEPATIAAEALKRLATAAVIGAIIGGLIAICGMVVVLGKQNPEVIIQGLTSAMGILAAFGLFIAGLGVIQRDLVKDQKFLSGIGAVCAGVAALILSVAAALKIISTIPVDDLMVAGAAVGVIMLVLMGFVSLCALLSKESETFSMGIKTALSLSALILAITLAVGLLSMVVQKDNPAALLIAAGGVLMIMLGLAAICAAMSKIEAKPAIATTVALAVFFTGFTASMILLKDIPWDEMAKKLGVMAGTVVVLGYILRLLGENMNGKQLAVGVAGIALVTAVITGLAFLFKYVLQDVDVNKVYPNLLAMGGAVLALSVILWRLSELELKKVGVAAAALGAMTIVFGAFAFICAIVEGLDTEPLVANLVTIGVALGVLTALIANFDKLGDTKKIFIAELALLGMAGVLGAFAFICAIVDGLDTGPLVANLITIGVAMVALAGIAFVIGQDAIIKYIAIGELAMAGLAVILGLFGLVADYISQIDTEGLVANLKVLLIAVVVMAAIVGVLGFLVAGTGGVGLAIFGAGIIALLVLAGAMWAVAQVGNTFADVINNVAAAIDNFAGPFERLGEAFEKVADMDFEGILGNVVAMAAGIEAIGLTANAAKEGAEGIDALAGNITDLEFAVERITSALALFEGAAAGLETLITNVCNSLNQLIDGLNNAADAMGSDKLYTAVETMADTLKQFSTSKMYAVGIQMAEDIHKGFSDVAGTEAKSMMDDFAAGLEEGANQNSSKAYDAGLSLAQSFVEGFRSKEGIDSHSASEEAKSAMNDYGDGIKEGAKNNEPKAEESGKGLGQTVVDGTQNAIESGTATLQETMGNSLSSLQGVLDANHLGLTIDLQGTGAELLNSTGLSGVTGMFSKSGLTYKQKQGAAAEDAKRNSLYGYSTLEEFQRAGQAGLLAHKWSHHMKEAEAAENAEAAASGKNTKATKGSTKAKEENKEANESKTKAINEESEALDEETTAVEDNEQAIRDQAEQIEVVTEKFKDYLRAYQFSDPMKSAKGLTKTMSKLWTTEDKSLSKVTKTYKKLSKSLSNSITTVRKVVKFDGSGKYLKTLSDKLYKNVDKIEKKVLKSGKTIMKVNGAATKVFYKVGNTVEKMTIRTTKNIKKLGKQFEAARNFLANFNDEIEHQESSEDFIRNLRNIEKYVGATKFGKMADKAKNYLRGIVDQFSEVNNSMNILAKNIDGIGNVTSKNSKATAFVADSFLALAATLYDGSDAANEYATEHAKLLFLLENGLATQEEVDEHFQSYISRLKETIVEYRKTIYDNLSGSMDIWSKFNKNLMDEGEDLITNIESQIAGYYNWGNMLMELSKRGFDSGIIKMLTDEGVSSFGKAAKLMSMSSDELALFTIRYQQSQAVIETATDTALAAVANAQTRASLRAAAAQGDKTAQQQLKLSKKRKKELMEDAKAVADFQAQYNKLTAKEEKEYLKSLSKEERKVYKAQLKAAKKQQAQLKKAAKREETKRAEKERLKAIIDGIKSMSDYLKVTRDYNKDAKAMAEVNKKIAEGLKPIQGTFTGITFGVNDATNSILAFGESLEATGEEGLTYFEEITKRIQKFREEIVDSIKSVDILTTSFERAAKVSIETIMSNGLSQLTANEDLNSVIEQLKGKGYNLNVLNKIKEMITSDRAQAIEYITTMLGANADQIDYINAEYDKLAEQANKIDDSTTRMMAGATSREVLDNNIKAAEKQLKEAEDVRDKAHQKVIKAEEDYNKLAEQRDKAYLKYMDLKRRKEQLEAIKKTGKLTKAQKKELKELSGVMGKVSAAQVLWQGLAQKTGDARARVGDAMLEEAKAQELLNNRLAEYNKAMEELTKYDAEHQKAVDKLTNDIKLRQWFNSTIDSIDKFKSSLKSLSRSSGEWGFLRDMVTDFMKPFDKVKEVFDESGNFSVIKSMADLSAGMKPIEDGLISFSATIASFDPEDSFETKMKKMKDALVEYQSTLESSIRSSSDFFSMFSGFSDEDNPLTATNYLEYADSQLAALKEWQENLKKLADKGLDKELLEKFASQGLGSYEQVNAWVNATEAQIGEYNKLWKDYNESVTSASETALAAIGAAWSSAGQSLQEMMIEAFGGNSERFKEMGYESSLMIITGVKDGLTNAMPEIISAVEQSTSSTAMASVLGKEVGTAINSGLTAAISSSVTDTVNAAIEKFKMAVDSVNLYVQETLNTDFTITVHVDTSEIDAAVARMNNAIYGINAQAGTTSQAVTSSQENQAAAALEPVDSSSPITNNITFNQTNTSPKALSQTEIYLDTKHQLQAMDNRLKLMNG